MVSTPTLNRDLYDYRAFVHYKPGHLGNGRPTEFDIKGGFRSMDLVEKLRQSDAVEKVIVKRRRRVIGWEDTTL